MEQTHRYRIYTELKNLAVIEDIVAAEFCGFTMFPAKGVWNGQAEKSLVIEIISDAPDALEKVKDIADGIKGVNSQEAVFITKEAIQAELI